jgi:hypothetical protein
MLHPITEWGRQRFGGADLPAERQLSDLENTLALIKLDPAENVPLLAPLLDIPVPPERRPILAPEELRRRQLAALTSWVMAGARRLSHVTKVSLGNARSPAGSPVGPPQNPGSPAWGAVRAMVLPWPIRLQHFVLAQTVTKTPLQAIETEARNLEDRYGTARFADARLLTQSDRDLVLDPGRPIARWRLLCLMGVPGAQAVGIPYQARTPGAVATLSLLRGALPHRALATCQ